MRNNTRYFDTIQEKIITYIFPSSNIKEAIGETLLSGVIFEAKTYEIIKPHHGFINRH